MNTTVDYDALVHELRGRALPVGQNYIGMSDRAADAIEQLSARVKAYDTAIEKVKERSVLKVLMLDPADPDYEWFNKGWNRCISSIESALKESTP